MDFKSVIESDVLDVFFSDEFTKTANFTYFDTGEVINDVLIIVTDAGESQQNYGMANLSTIIVKRADYHTFPAKNDIFITDNAIYSISSLAKYDSHTITFYAVSQQRINPK